MDISLEDIKSVQAFVTAIVSRWIRYSKSSPYSGEYKFEVDKEEAFAEGMVLLYEIHSKWDPSKSKAPFSVYAMKILTFRMTDWWRKEFRRKFPAMDKKMARPDEVEWDPLLNLSTFFDEEMESEAVVIEFVENLDDIDKKMVFYSMSGYMVPEIAEMLDVPKSHLYNRRAKLRELLEEKGITEAVVWG